MLRSRALWLGLFSFAVLAVEAAPATADVPPFGGPRPPFFNRDNRPNPAPTPTPQPTPVPPIPPPDFGDEPPPAPRPDLLPNPLPTPQPTPPVDFPPKKTEPPKRPGPFRSCGSGAGLGLAGIALAWGMLWFGNRVASRVSRSAKK